MARVMSILMIQCLLLSHQWRTHTHNTLSLTHIQAQLARPSLAGKQTQHS